MPKEIKVELKSSRDLGTCNACSNWIGADGVIEEHEVFKISLLNMNFRLCRECKEGLTQGLIDESLDIKELL